MSAQKFFKKRLLDGPAEFDAQFSPGPGPGPTKRVKGKHPERAAPVVGQGLLAQYYARIHTLRHYVLSQLPKSSRIRQRKIASVGLALPAPEKPCTNDELALGELLDTTLVAIRYDDDHGARSKTELGQRWEQWIGFSQKGDESYVTLSDGLKASCFSQSELVDFVIWLLFSREKTGSWPRHILCDGFRRQNGSRPPAGPENPAGQIQGLFSAHPNHSVQALKEPPWPQLLALLGKAGERIMIELLVDCAVFRAVKAGKGNLHQLSGIPLSSLETLAANSADQLKPSSKILVKNNEELRPSEISFVRSRMLYARAALNARGLVHFGLRHIRRLFSSAYSKTGSAHACRCVEPFFSERYLQDWTVWLASR
ncbi:hypothetical protein B0T22DRAFT_89502 [Podospora appendiculata]|uniref:Telomerase reverse transcriptase n=1 Tax=Podospora appendiculata TaxID=314037 RepID=A0AAE0XKB0_9PEZI|nr:hypothetical protein B0T22DRAFT_89502 [Podospora appendiculata]